MSTTDRFRWIFVALWIVSILAALAGWLFFDRDPSTLAPVIGWITAAAAVGEASNVGKRATWKKEAVET